MTHNFYGPMISGDSVDMTDNGKTLLTGGGTSGEGLQVWDLRNTETPILNIKWIPHSNLPQPSINSCRFIERCNMIVATVSDDIAVKCFNLTTGQVMHEFQELNRCSYFFDITRDSEQMCLSDVNGNVFLKSLIYEKI